MSEPTWTAKMFDENKALKAKVEELIEERNLAWDKGYALGRDDAHQTIVALQAKVEELDNFIELVEGALGCTDGDDIRTHIEPELAALKEDEL